MSTWRETFQYHVIRMNPYFKRIKPPIKSDVKIYLAGYYARFLDEEYKKQIKPYIIEDLETFKNFIKKHEFKLGQNAPVFFYAKLNAEYKMFQLLEESIKYKNYKFHKFYLTEPAILFSITSNYYRMAGKLYHALLFEILYKRIQDIFSVFHYYTQSLGYHYKQKYLESEEKEEILDVSISDNEIHQFLNEIHIEISDEKNQIQKKDYYQLDFNLDQFFLQS